MATPESVPQLPLPLFDRTDRDLADFIPGPNQLAFDALRAWIAGDGPWLTYFWGGSGTGKSHLLQSAIQATSDDAARAMYLPIAEVMGFGPAVLHELESIEFLALDDIDAVCGDKPWETAIFDLYNRVSEHGHRLLLASSYSPKSAPFELEDLSSRLQAGLTIQMLELSDADKEAVLKRRAFARGLRMPAPVARYITSRMQRDMHALNDIFEQIDSASLSSGRELTIPFVRDVLGLS